MKNESVDEGKDSTTGDSLLTFKPLNILRAEADGLTSWKPVEGQLELGGATEEILTGRG